MAYQDELRQAYIDKAEEDDLRGDPVDLRAELAVQRDLLYMFMGKYARSIGIELPDLPLLETGEDVLDGKEKTTVMDPVYFIKTVYGMIHDITRVTAQISTSRKDTVLSMAAVDHLRLVLEETFVKFIPDPGKREAALRHFDQRANHKALTEKVR